jgi:hypothetical protein
MTIHTEGKTCNEVEERKSVGKKNKLRDFVVTRAIRPQRKKKY